MQDLGDITHPLFNGLGRFFGCLQRKGDILINIQMGIERVELKHEGDITVTGFQMLHRLAVDQDLTGIYFFQPGNAAQDGCFAATGCPQQNQKFSIFDLQV